MTKEEFKQHWMAMYRVANRSDADPVFGEPLAEAWTHPRMSGRACCQLLDKMARELRQCGVWTEEEHQEMLNSL